MKISRVYISTTPKVEPSNSGFSDQNTVNAASKNTAYKPDEHRNMFRLTFAEDWLNGESLQAQEFPFSD